MLSLVDRQGAPMTTPRLTAVGVWFYLLCMGTVVSSQGYPNRPVRIMTSGIGGNGDFASRLVGQSLGDSLGQPIIIDNRGGSTMAAEIAQKAPPDGYTLLLEGGSFWVAPLL